MLCLVCLALPAQARQTASIIAVVNDGAISFADLEDRIRLIIVSSGMPDTKEIRDRMRGQVINSLIDEQLQIQEADRLELEVTDEEVDQAFEGLAQSNNFTAEKFLDVLKQSKVPLHTLRSQIRANIAWSKVVQNEVRPRISIADTEVDVMRERLEEGVGKTEYMVSEIFLAVETPKDESDVKQLAEKLTRQLVEGHVPFSKIAAQFSQSAGASRGGDMGWVREGQLAEEIDHVLQNMDEGDLSAPVRTLSGYHIIYLRKKRTIEAANIPSATELMNQIGQREMERRARGYLMDLKSTAFIEFRDKDPE